MKREIPFQLIVGIAIILMSLLLIPLLPAPDLGALEGTLMSAFVRAVKPG